MFSGLAATVGASYLTTNTARTEDSEYMLAPGLIYLNFIYFNRATSNNRPARLTFTPPLELAFNDTEPDVAVISPDGQKIAFRPRDNKTEQGHQCQPRHYVDGLEDAGP